MVLWRFLFKEKLSISEFTKQIGNGRRKFEKCYITRNNSHQIKSYPSTEIKKEDPIRLYECSFQNVELNELYIPYIQGERNVFYQVSFNNTILTEAHLDHSQIIDCQFEATDLTDSYILHSRIYCCKIRDTDFENTSLIDTLFENTDLDNVNLTLATLCRTSFKSCRLNRVILLEAKGLDLTRDLETSTLTGIEVSQRELEILKKTQPQKYKIIPDN